MTHIRNILAGATLAASLVHSSDDALLSALGLAGGEETPAEPTEAETPSEAEAATKAPRTELKITGEIATQKRRGLPVLERSGFGGGGKRGSKYPFEGLAAPEADGDDFLYDSFTVKLTDVENADAAKLRGAIQAAVAAQNKQTKEDGSNVYYISRTETGENGEYVGSTVYRTDARPVNEK